MAPHAPYAPPDPFWQTFAPEVSRTERVVYENLETLEEGEVDAAMLDKLRALYDAEIAASDTSFGFVLDALMARGLYRDAGIVFVSDHGEEFREHGRLGHGHHLHAETQRIPLLVKPPGSRGGGRRIGEPVSLVDLLPTLLDWAELPSPTEFVAATESRKASELDGVSLAAALQGGGRVDGASEAVFAHLFFGPSAMRTSVTDSRWTLIRTLAPNGRGESLELYDRVADPQNETDVADHHPDAVARLLTLLQREDERTPSWPVPDFEPEPTMLEQLEALGYVQ